MKLKYRILAIATSVTVVLDQLTKSWILREFRVADSIPVIPGLFNITYVRNMGAAFGLLAHAEPAFRIPFFTIIPLVALGAIVYVLRRLDERDIKMSVALSLVVGGAVGNLLDRVRWSFVIDFLDFHWHHLYHFPAFNVADSAICVGVGILMIELLLRDSIEPRISKEGASINASTSV